MTDTSPAFAPEDLTRLTVNLTPRAAAAMDAAAERLGDTKTDTVNRALIIYESLTRLEVGDGLLFTRKEGEPIRLARLPSERRRFWLSVWAMLSPWKTGKRPVPAREAAKETTP